MSFFPVYLNAETRIQYLYVLTINGKSIFRKELKTVINMYIDETKFISTKGELVHSNPIEVAEYLLEHGNYSCVTFNNGKVDKQINITYIVTKEEV